MADAAKVKAMDKVASVRKWSSETIFIADGYSLTFPDKSFIGATGHLVVFELRSASAELPHFEGRWDQKESALDIDVRGVSKAEQRRFKNSECKSSGHHTVRDTKNGWMYALDVAYRGEKVFVGTVGVALDHEASFKASVTFSATFTAQVIRATDGPSTHRD